MVNMARGAEEAERKAAGFSTLEPDLGNTSVGKCVEG
jgi:hypothetical protein